ncbi:hypothetical protein PanWU01x14_259190 [Parasponia andersonii]|uniref:Uncharacterized protein n=1 Tax=Parasponia andersonii TaxID=3476 RepID=A0A2P5B9H4_PARAD|nr:hypothetical protein PanWU01x14_259190 [Parasponia andersonii]
MRNEKAESENGRDVNRQNVAAGFILVQGRMRFSWSVSQVGGMILF